MYAGTAVIQGNGVVLALAVGECTQSGGVLLHLQKGRRGFCGKKKKTKSKDPECGDDETFDGCFPDHVYYEYDESQSLLQRKLHRFVPYRLL